MRWSFPFNRKRAMHRHRILLIEDEKELAELLAELLDGIGYEVRLALTFEAAETHLADFEPCAVVSDLTLPDIPRDELVGRLRARVGATPIYLISAIAAPELRAFASRHGADGALAKPFDLDAFERTIVPRCPEDRSEPAPAG